jgi:hypothetical protein
VTVRGQVNDRELVLAPKACRREARGALIEAFTPLIGNVARGYRGASGVGRAELMQQGVVGLLRALERYDPELETPFWAYASWWVSRRDPSRPRRGPCRVALPPMRVLYFLAHRLAMSGARTGGRGKIGDAGLWSPVAKRCSSWCPS